jgi:hypothetical protein
LTKVGRREISQFGALAGTEPTTLGFGAQQAWAATLVPLLLAAAYAATFPALYVGAPEGYGSIDAVLTLLTADRRIALAAWLHYLAFDLLVGWMIVREARSLGIVAPWRVPALALTFLFGPAGCYGSARRPACAASPIGLCRPSASGLPHGKRHLTSPLTRMGSKPQGIGLPGRNCPRVGGDHRFFQ